jgi:hypothetical protein
MKLFATFLLAALLAALCACAEHSSHRGPEPHEKRVTGNAGVEMRSENLSRVLNQGPGY